MILLSGSVVSSVGGHEAVVVVLAEFPPGPSRVPFSNNALAVTSYVVPHLSP